ncbi:hypothetical protein ACRALDRAFT_2014709 [Sodiomyces alcalophilus JCM 7366]|uniref:uncharacterized protein n=1 Tax=Sodiomyces alcalophilus JCM 7366 TaxID=591952 RepID=UPI0039B6C354
MTYLLNDSMFCNVYIGVRGAMTCFSITVRHPNSGVVDDPHLQPVIAAPDRHQEACLKGVNIILFAAAPPWHTINELPTSRHSSINGIRSHIDMESIVCEEGVLCFPHGVSQFAQDDATDPPGFEAGPRCPRLSVIQIGPPWNRDIAPNSPKVRFATNKTWCLDFYWLDEIEMIEANPVCSIGLSRCPRTKLQQLVEDAGSQSEPEERTERGRVQTEMRRSTDTLYDAWMVRRPRAQPLLDH